VGAELPLASTEFNPCWVPIKCNVAWAEAYLDTKWHLDPCSRLATKDTGRKLGDCATLEEGELGTHVTESAQRRDLSASKFRLDPFNRLATIHQRHRQTDRTTLQWLRANRFTNGRPNTVNNKLP